jgi:hypothetical protein
MQNYSLNIGLLPWHNSWSKKRNVTDYISLNVQYTTLCSATIFACARATTTSPQSNESTRGPPELVQHFRLHGEFTSAQERCMSYICYGLATSLAYPSGEEGDNFLVLMISTCLRYTLRKRGRGSAHCATSSQDYNVITYRNTTCSESYWHSFKNNYITANFNFNFRQEIPASGGVSLNFRPGGAQPR